MIMDWESSIWVHSEPETTRISLLGRPFFTSLCGRCSVDCKEEYRGGKFGRKEISLKIVVIWCKDANDKCGTWLPWAAASYCRYSCEIEKDCRCNRCGNFDELWHPRKFKFVRWFEPILMVEHRTFAQKMDYMLLFKPSMMQLHPPRQRKNFQTTVPRNGGSLTDQHRQAV
jgi:hypothetical protein